MPINEQGAKGFTLLELSIVIAVIGLLIGGIVVGSSLMRAAHLQAAISEYDAYVKDIKLFQDKYHALPGDMVGAQALWGQDAHACPYTASSTTRQIGTCDGNGDGMIGSSDASGNTSNQNEWFRAWQHLSNAGLIEATFTGTQSAGGASEATPGLNVPASKLPGAGWTLFYFLNPTTSSSYWGQRYGHILYLGGFAPTSITASPILTPAETLGIDSKIDDGKPGTGIMQVPRTAVQANCTVSDTTSQITPVYNTSSNRYACAPFFILELY